MDIDDIPLCPNCDQPIMFLESAELQIFSSHGCYFLMCNHCAHEAAKEQGNDRGRVQEMGHDQVN